jgi:hypothetical protein
MAMPISATPCKRSVLIFADWPFTEDRMVPLGLSTIGWGEVSDEINFKRIKSIIYETLYFRSD